MYTPWARAGAALAMAIAPTNPSASNVLVTNMGFLLFLSFCSDPTSQCFHPFQWNTGESS
jgi:hypothetical protein